MPGRLVDAPAAQIRLDLDTFDEIPGRLHHRGSDPEVAAAAGFAIGLEHLRRHAALAGDLEAALECFRRIHDGLRHVLVVRMHPELAAGRVDDRPGLAEMVRVGVGADEQPHVLEPQSGLVERELELAQRPRLVDPGVDEHDPVARRDRPGVSVRDPGPGQRQPQPPQARKHPVGAGQVSPPCGHGGNLGSASAALSAHPG